MQSKTGILHTISCLLAGQTLMRILMNRALAHEVLVGKVVDVGGGRKPDYYEYFQKEHGVTVEPVDGSLSGIDFETDTLPHKKNSIDTVVLCNVLEHIYHYAHLLKEIRRILKLEGRLIGYVPFWIGYHPDPHDYFRYTREALEKILLEAGFTQVRIEPIGGSPIIANFNTLVLSVPRIVRPPMYLLYAALDAVFLRLRPHSKDRNPLGFVFIASV